MILFEQNLFNRVLTHWFVSLSTLVQIVAWHRQATSHHLNHSWPNSRTQCSVTRPQKICAEQRTSPCLYQLQCSLISAWSPHKNHYTCYGQRTYNSCPARTSSWLVTLFDWIFITQNLNKNHIWQSQWEVQNRLMYPIFDFKVFIRHNMVQKRRCQANMRKIVTRFATAIQTIAVMLSDVDPLIMSAVI